MGNTTLPREERILEATPGAAYRYHVAIVQGRYSEYPDPRTLAIDPKECLMRAKKLNPVLTIARVMEVGVTLLCEVPV